jgi:hypothetical protein
MVVYRHTHEATILRVWAEGGDESVLMSVLSIAVVSGDALVIHQGVLIHQGASTATWSLVVERLGLTHVDGDYWRMPAVMRQTVQDALRGFQVQEVDGSARRRLRLTPDVVTDFVEVHARHMHMVMLWIEFGGRDPSPTCTRELAWVDRVNLPVPNPPWGERSSVVYLRGILAELMEVRRVEVNIRALEDDPLRGAGVRPPG